MIFTSGELRLINRETLAWLYRGDVISDEVAHLIAKDYAENAGHPERDYSSFYVVTYGNNYPEWENLIADIGRELEILENLISAIRRELEILPEEFCNGPEGHDPEIRRLSALKIWAEEKKQGAVEREPE
jgi:hypothetical protein